MWLLLSSHVLNHDLLKIETVAVSVTTCSVKCSVLGKMKIAWVPLPGGCKLMRKKCLVA